jgi:hypothetical protein
LSLTVCPIVLELAQPGPWDYASAELLGELFVSVGTEALLKRHVGSDKVVQAMWNGKLVEDWWILFRWKEFGE